MNDTATVGDRVRINTAYYSRDRHLDGREGTVVSRVDNYYLVRLETGQTVKTMALTKLQPVNRSRFGPVPTTRDRLVQIDPSALNISTLDGRRVQAAQAAKQILGEVSVSEITELASFLAPAEPEATSATASARDTSAEMETARRIVRGGHSGASGISVRMDETDDDDVAEVSGYYLRPTEVRDLIAFLGAALLVHEAKRDTPF